MNTKLVKAGMAAIMVFTLGACSQEKKEITVLIEQTEHTEDGQAHVKPEEFEINSGETIEIFDQSWTVTKTGDSEYVLNTENQYHDIDDEGGFYLTDGFNLEAGDSINLEDNSTNFTYRICVENAEATE